MRVQIPSVTPFECSLCLEKHPPYKWESVGSNPTTRTKIKKEVIIIPMYITSSNVWIHYECPSYGHSDNIEVDADTGQGCSLEVYDIECEKCGEIIDAD